MPDKDNMRAILDFTNSLSNQLAELRLSFAKGEIDRDAYVLMSNIANNSVINTLSSTIYFSSSENEITKRMCQTLMQEQQEFLRQYTAGNPQRT